MKDSLDKARRTTTRGVRTILTPTGMRGTGLEVAWIAAHLAMMPMGFLREKVREPEDRYSLDGLSPVKRGMMISDVEAAGTPILLVHGVVDNRSIFLMLRRSLLRRGFGRVVTMNYSPIHADIPTAARRLGRLIEQVCAETGYERVHVVGHSLGGLIGRYYVQRLGGDHRVHTLATLGAPHGGTHAARLLPPKIIRQLRPDSSVIEELSRPAPDCRTRFVAFWSDLDEMIVPKRSARIEHPDLSARNVLLRGVGHLSLPIDSRVVWEIATTLAHLGEDGRTITAGVTAIDAVPSGLDLAAPSQPVWRRLRRAIAR